ncbi:MAG: molybdopterin cofactor-binding domain-containing protein [Candidatus Thiodiazotropha sp.]
MKRFRPDRRRFLKLSAASLGSGLTLGICWSGLNAAATNATEDFQPNAWLSIDKQGLATLYVAESEMGQGVYTALPMLIAEELEADWRLIRVEHASLDPSYGFQGTGGSRSVRKAWKILREAGAIARHLLISAAAQQWGVERDTCFARMSRVIHRTSGRSLSYAELVERASQLPLPDSVALKQADEYTLIGNPLPRMDLAGKIDGSAVFGIDVRRPGQLYASIRQSPVFGGRVKSFNAQAVKELPGVVDCFALEEGVVVVARSTWQAFQAREALRIDWSEGTQPGLDNAQVLKQLSTALESSAGKTILQRGDPSTEPEPQGRRIERDYSLPFQAHMTPEPMNCTVQIEGQQVRIWAPTQSPTSARSSAIEALRSLGGDWALASDDALQQRIEINTTLLGGGFGRRILQDYVTQGVKIAARFKQPVQLVWPRDEDLQHDYYHPFTLHKMSGVLDEQGLPRVWRHRIAGLKADHYGADELPYDIPQVKVELNRLDTPVPIGPWRSVTHHYHAFAIEHFFDELARAGGQDPLQLRLKLLTQPRLRQVLEIAAESAGWDHPDKHRQLGCAVHSGFGSHVAEIVELRASDRQLRVAKVTCVVDCGQVINPDTLKAQMEGSIVFGLSAALKSPITLDRGRVTQSNFHDYPILRFHETPDIEVIIVPSTQDPGGAGEPGVPPLAPALANALLAAQGTAGGGLPVVW